MKCKVADSFKRAYNYGDPKVCAYSQPGSIIRLCTACLSEQANHDSEGVVRFIHIVLRSTPSHLHPLFYLAVFGILYILTYSPYITIASHHS
jgi:hypothetical protein